VNGLLIRDTRVSLNISLRGLAATLGVTPAFLGEVERGKRPVPKGWEQKLAAFVPDWETAARSCVINKHPEYAALLTRADVPQCL
jgi:transcriptional regulator with XRE-family HTH domain